ncbi:MAG: HAMP domain-containing histidine kinase [Sphingobacteriaceae bacterium]|nr:MAG: HAMP domain-containing histidine kinase [Sphingobacteriaceae bacterium]
MVKPPKNVYRKNFSLIIIFLILITIILVIAFITAYNLTGKYVENEFASKKIEVYEQTISPYEDFFQNKIPEITSYQGFLDSASAGRYSGSVFYNYNFVRKIDFYDIRITAPPVGRRRLGISVRSVHQYEPKGAEIISTKKYTPPGAADFVQMAGKLNDFIITSDTVTVPTQSEIFRTFYDVKPDKISYLNVPRRQDVRLYKELFRNKNGAFYKQNMLTFLLNPAYLRIRNPHPELYQEITLQPVVYDPLNISENKLVTEVALPGAFSNYKLYFISDKDHLIAEINRRFMPIGGMVLLIYAFILLTGWLIYRNLSVNLKLFKLQYDFINNFTHEFKTPVSVIKIAGSNLRGENVLSERQLKHYGKILDEEADKLNELMNRLLSFTQLENRSIATKKEGIDIETFAKGYIDTFRMKYPDFAINFEMTGVNFFYADPMMLGSVFQNLMENAYKYSHPQKKELDIKIWHERKTIFFSFTDKGIGVPKTELNNIFRKFYRLENQYNQNGSVGLGLAFCKELVNFMNGDITVKSRVNQGSEFIVSLPYQT